MFCAVAKAESKPPEQGNLPESLVEPTNDGVAVTESDKLWSTEPEVTSSAAASSTRSDVPDMSPPQQELASNLSQAPWIRNPPGLPPPPGLEAQKGPPARSRLPAPDGGVYIPTPDPVESVTGVPHPPGPQQLSSQKVQRQDRKKVAEALGMSRRQYERILGDTERPRAKQASTKNGWLKQGTMALLFKNRFMKSQQSHSSKKHVLEFGRHSGLAPCRACMKLLSKHCSRFFAVIVSTRRAVVRRRLSAICKQ